MSKTYTTIQGDMWDSIAFSQLGDVAHTDALMLANRAYLGYYIFPSGIVLALPEVDDAAPGSAVPPWKKVSG